MSPKGGHCSCLISKGESMAQDRCMRLQEPANQSKWILEVQLCTLMVQSDIESMYRNTYIPINLGRFAIYIQQDILKLMCCFLLCALFCCLNWRQTSTFRALDQSGEMRASYWRDSLRSECIQMKSTRVHS